MRLGHDQAANSKNGMTQHATHGAVGELIEPNLAVANDPIMRVTRREYMPGSRACPPHRTRIACGSVDGNTRPRTAGRAQPNITPTRTIAQTSRGPEPNQYANETRTNPLTRPHSFIHADRRSAQAAGSSRRALRSAALRPPQMPSGSLTRSA